MEAVGLIRKSRDLAITAALLEQARQAGNERKIRLYKKELDEFLRILKKDHFDRAIIEVQGLRHQIQETQEELVRHITFYKQINGLMTWIKDQFIPVIRVWESEKPARIVLPEIMEELEQRLGLPEEINGSNGN